MASLPNEILLDIFEYLSYWDLKIAIPCVCRRFRSLTENPSSFMRKIQFLNGPINRSPTTSDRFEPHPAFKLIRYNCVDTLDRIVFRRRCQVCHRGLAICSHSYTLDPHRLIDNPSMHENAIYPTVSSLYIRIAHFQSFRITKGDSVCNPGWMTKVSGWSSRRETRGGEGLTVLDIMSAVNNFLWERMPQDMIPPVLMGRYTRQHGRPVGVTRGQILHNEYRRRWEGVNKIEIVNDMVFMRVLC